MNTKRLRNDENKCQRNFLGFKNNENNEILTQRKYVLLQYKIFNQEAFSGCVLVFCMEFAIKKRIVPSFSLFGGRGVGGLKNIFILQFRFHKSIRFESVFSFLLFVFHVDLLSLVLY